MAPNGSVCVFCFNTVQYSRDVQGKLNAGFFVARVTKMFGNVRNDQEYKV